MTYEEIVELIKKNYKRVDDFVECDGSDKYRPEGMIPFKEVYQEGGEGEGEHFETVKHFVEDDIYISIYGTYTSHEGVDYWDGWDSLQNTYPTEVTKIEYHSRK